MTLRIKPSGVWPKNVIADLVGVWKVHSIQLHMVVGSEVLAILDEKIPSSNIKWSESLLKNKIVKSIVVDPTMPQNQAILHDGEKSIIIENIVIEEE